MLDYITQKMRPDHFYYEKYEAETTLFQTLECVCQLYYQYSLKKALNKLLSQRCS